MLHSELSVIFLSSTITIFSYLVELFCTGQSEYQRGVSAWHFDVEDLKAQASLVYATFFIFVNHQDISYEVVIFSLLFIC